MNIFIKTFKEHLKEEKRIADKERNHIPVYSN